MVLAWVVIAVITTAIAQSAGRNYATNFTLPGTESQRALDLLQHHFPTQSGDLDTIVFRTSSGTIDDAAVQQKIVPLLNRVGHMPHVAAVVSPYSNRGALQVSRDRKTAFATIYYDKRGNLLPNSTGTPLLNAVAAASGHGLQVAAGGHGRRIGRVGSGTLTAVRAAAARTSDVTAVTPPRISPSGTVAVIQVYPA